MRLHVQELPPTVAPGAAWVESPAHSLLRGFCAAGASGPVGEPLVGEDGDPAKAQGTFRYLQVGLLRSIPGGGMLQVEVAPEKKVRGGRWWKGSLQAFGEWSCGARVAHKGSRQ